MSKTLLISTIFRYLDIFGVKPKLLIGKKDKYNSVIGGIFSFFFFITVILGCIYFGKELFKKEKPTLLQSSLFDSFPHRYNLSQDNFAFFIGVQDRTLSNFYDPTIYNFIAMMSVTYRHFDEINKNPFYEFTSIPLRTEQCQLDRHFTNFKGLFSSQNLKLYTCIHPEDSSKLFIEGMWGEESYARLSMKAMPCINGTSVICKSQEEIDEKLGGGYFGVDIVDTIFDPSDYLNPNKFIRRNMFTSLSNKYYKTFYLFFNNIDYSTDTGILIEDLEKKNYLQLEKTYEIIDFRDNPKPFFNFEIRFSNIRQTFIRKYFKVQDFIAQLGGLIKGIMIILNIILRVFTRTDYYSHLINESYIINNKNNKLKLPLQPNRIKDHTENELKTNIPLENNYTNSAHLVKIENQFKTLGKLKILRKNLKLSVSEIIKINLCCKIGDSNGGIRYYRIGKKHLEANLNIVNVNMLSEELKIFRAVLFNKFGNNLFNFIIKNVPIDDIYQGENLNYNDLVESYNNTPNNFVTESLKKLFESTVDKVLN